MSNWRYLPLDILGLVFQYLEQDFSTTIYPIRLIKVQSNDTFQCQLTCKNWAFLAQQKIYERVILKSIQQLNLFAHTLQNSDMGPLVYHIYLQLEEKEETKTKEALLDFIRCIATFCTALKTLYMDSNNFQGVWKVIRDARSGGDFKMLQAIPFVKDQRSEDILDYNDVAFTLQQTLRELAIYYSQVSLEESKLWHFPNADTVFFKFNDFEDACFINRHMKWLPSVTGIEIELKNQVLNQDKVNSEFIFHISPQVKQLSVKKESYSNALSNYIMKALPNLQKIVMDVGNVFYEQAPVSTDEIVNFLEYLLGIHKLSVRCIPIGNQNDIMWGLRGKNRHIKKLIISYMPCPYLRGSSYLSIGRRLNVKESVIINIVYKADIPPLLPRIGLIEQLGKDLQYIEIDMGLRIFDKSSIKPDLDDGITFSGILQQCPNIFGIFIRNAILNTFGTHLQIQNKTEVYDYIIFNSSLINISFLPSLSFYVYYIPLFTLRDCYFTDEITRGSIREIDMYDTKFDDIVYADWALAEKAYLKLTKAIDNTISWYMAQDFYINTCTEKDYQDSLQDQDVLSLSIRCKDVFKVRVSLPKLDVIFNP